VTCRGINWIRKCEPLYTMSYIYIITKRELFPNPLLLFIMELIIYELSCLWCWVWCSWWCWILRSRLRGSRRLWPHPVL